MKKYTILLLFLILVGGGIAIMVEMHNSPSSPVTSATNLNAPSTKDYSTSAATTSSIQRQNNSANTTPTSSTNISANLSVFADGLPANEIYSNKEFFLSGPGISPCISFSPNVGCSDQIWIGGFRAPLVTNSKYLTAIAPQLPSGNYEMYILYPDGEQSPSIEVKILNP